MIPDEVADRLALDQFNRDEDRSVVFVHVKHLGDGRMTDPGGRASLEQESFSPFRIGCQFSGKNLYGDGPLELEVLRPVNDAHSALTDHTVKAVVLQGLSDISGQHYRYGGRIHLKAGHSRCDGFTPVPLPTQGRAALDIAVIKSRSNIDACLEPTEICAAR